MGRNCPRRALTPRQSSCPCVEGAAGPARPALPLHLSFARTPSAGSRGTIGWFDASTSSVGRAPQRSRGGSVLSSQAAGALRGARSRPRATECVPRDPPALGRARARALRASLGRARRAGRAMPPSLRTPRACAQRFARRSEPFDQVRHHDGVRERRATLSMVVGSPAIDGAVAGPRAGVQPARRNQRHFAGRRKQDGHRAARALEVSSAELAVIVSTPAGEPAAWPHGASVLVRDREPALGPFDGSLLFGNVERASGPASPEQGAEGPAAERAPSSRPEPQTPTPAVRQLGPRPNRVPVVLLARPVTGAAVATSTGCSSWSRRPRSCRRSSTIPARSWGSTHASTKG
jgi:hypothetical protein